MRYDHKSVEKKWQKFWDENKTFAAHDEYQGERRYVLDMFPYPSAEGLHVGHPEGYTATDIYCRYLRMKEVSVLHPMGWDAFGLPTENYAIKVKRNPKEVAAENIANFKRQIKSLGFSYDWEREINTSDPAYYKWTQWLFLKLYKKGLAYRKEAPVNWCPSCQTVLANEQVAGGECERCHSIVEQKQMAQWLFKITDYAERLLKDLDGLDWPPAIIEMQKNWIGKSEGAIVEFAIRNSPPQADLNPRLMSLGFKPWAGQSVIPIYTTRLDTIFGATYVVLAPEHESLMKLKPQITNWPAVEKYIAAANRKTELERKVEEKEKTGVRLEGVEAVNPATKEPIPIFIADYVLMGYGTGAIMAVPAHDKRDWEFAKKFNLPIKIVICPHYPEPTCPVLESAYVGEGHLVDSGDFNGLSSAEAKTKIAKRLGAKLAIQYKLRDWLISRQRYWGAPIPIIYCDSPAGGCGIAPVPEKDLPVLLPDDVDFRPTGESPLARSKSFHETKCPQCGKPARRESDTMDTFVDSSWYFLRYADPRNDAAPFSQEKVERWLPVSLYIGGAEHAVMHLLYARFFSKALADLGLINFSEPFVRLRNQGLVLGEDGQKMSKSRGNVVNPDEVTAVYGADSFRLYEMFMGPLEDSKPWNTASISGVRRFLERVWHITLEPDVKGAPAASAEQEDEIRYWSAKTIKKVTDDIESFRFNTAISALMEFVNLLFSLRTVSTPLKDDARQTLLILLYPFAPHITSELWQIAFPKAGYLWEEPWLKYDPEALQTDTVTIVVQVNGKLRGNIVCQRAAGDEEVVELAKAEPNVSKWLAGKKVLKTIVKSGKLVNFVIE